jgi:hypothetical protein
MKMRLIGALAAAAALLLATVPVSLAASERAFDTTPDITTDSPTGYYIWRSDDTIHVRTHGPGARHDFDAVLTTDGTFENVDPVRLEEHDRVDLRDGGHQLVMRFTTFDATDGVNFNVRDGEHLRFNLKLDDRDIGTDHIFIGANGHHPKSNPFSIKL